MLVPPQRITLEYLLEVSRLTHAIVIETQTLSKPLDYEGSRLRKWNCGLLYALYHLESHAGILFAM